MATASTIPSTAEITFSGSGGSYIGGQGLPSVWGDLLYSVPVTEPVAFTGLSFTVTDLVDQGWGGTGASNGFTVTLLVDDAIVWSSPYLIASHTSQPLVTFTASQENLSGLNQKVAAVDWTGEPAVKIGMYANAMGWPGWRLKASSTAFTATALAVPEPSALALLGLGVGGFAIRRRRA